MKRKIIALIVTACILLQTVAVSLVLVGAAEKTEKGVAVAIPVAEADSFSGTKVISKDDVSNFTTAFDYKAGEDNSVKLSYDFDSSLKKTVFSEDFENYKGTLQTAQFGTHGTAGKLVGYGEKFNAFTTDNDFELTAFVAVQNPDWGAVRIYLKSDLYLYLGGNKKANPRMLQLVNRESLLAEYDTLPLPSGQQMFNDGSYLNVVLKGDKVTVSVSADSTFTENEIFYTATLPENGYTKENSISFEQYNANTGIFIDDIAVKDLNQSGYETVETRTYAEIYKDDFDAVGAAVPVNGVLTDDGNGGKMVGFSANHQTIEFSQADGNYSSVFFIKSNNPDWDNIEVGIRDNLKLLFKGKNLDSAAANKAYNIRLADNSSTYATVYPVNHIIGGIYVKIELLNGNVKVYLNSTDDFTNISPVITQNVPGLSNTGKFTVRKTDTGTYVDNITLYNHDDYDSDIKSNGQYGLIEVKGSLITVNKVEGSTVKEITRKQMNFTNGNNYRIAAIRDRNTVKVFADETEVISTAVPYDKNSFEGELFLEATDATVTDLKVYDSGRITFKDGEALLIPIELAENITALAKSQENNSLSYEDGKLYIKVPNSNTNGNVATSAWLKEEVGDLVLDFNIVTGRPDWIYDAFYITVPGTVAESSNSNPDRLYKNGYKVNFGSDSKTSPSHSVAKLYNSNESVISSVSSVPFYYGTDGGRVRIVRKGDKISAYSTNKNGDWVLFSESYDSTHVLGNVYFNHQQGEATVTDIVAYDTVNRVAKTAEDEKDYKKLYGEYLDTVETYLGMVKSGDRFDDNDIYYMKEFAKAAAKKTANEQNYNELRSVFEAFLNSGTPNTEFTLISDTENGDISSLKTLENKNVVNTGDVTFYGSEAEWKTYADKLKDMGIENAFTGLGTVELTSKYLSSFDIAKERFLSGLGSILPENTDKTYYSGNADGYSFMVLSPESRDGKTYTDTQIEFLKTSLAAADANKPVFIVTHSALYEAAVGKETFDKLNSAIEPYKDRTFVLSGNTDSAFEDGQQIISGFSYIDINVPVFAGGYGYTVEVYGDEVVFRAVDMAKNKLLPQYDLIFRNKNGKYYAVDRPTIEKPTELIAKYQFNNESENPITFRSYGEKLEENGSTAIGVVDGKLNVINTPGVGYTTSSFIGDTKINALNWSFDYAVTNCQWMTNEFYILSKDGSRNNCFMLRIRGINLVKQSNAAIDLFSITNGVQEKLGEIAHAGIVDGETYRINVKINKEKIEVSVRRKSLDPDEAAVIKADLDETQQYKGGIYMYGWDYCDLKLDNMEIYSGADISALKAPEISSPTKLIKYYNTAKTSEKLVVNAPAEFAEVGPWYSVSNIHGNAMYLQESITGDKAVRDFDMKFTYWAGGYWLTNEFYFASSDKFGTNSYVMRIRGEGTSKDRDNVELYCRYNNENQKIATMKVPNITYGGFDFHINVNKGVITVKIKPINADWNEAYVLTANAEDKIYMGGIYMYCYDEGSVKMRDIEIYDGADSSKAKKPDKSIEKNELINYNFDDGKSPVELYKNEKNGSSLSISNNKLRFNTNHNNYMQVGGFVKDDWLKDFTAEFDYLGHRGDWNIVRMGWHTSRKNGDLFDSLALYILGNNVAENEKAGDNIAKVKDANIQLVSRIYGQTKCIAYASLPELNEGREHRIRITQDRGKITVWIWPSDEDMPTEPIMTATEKEPVVTYGDFFVHAWCSDFSLDNMAITNYPNYDIPKPISNLSKPIGEIFRVDRIYETVEDLKEDKPVAKPTPPAPKKSFPIIWIIIPVAAVLAATGGVIFLILFKKHKKKEENK